MQGGEGQGPKDGKVGYFTIGARIVKCMIVYIGRCYICRMANILYPQDISYCVSNISPDQRSDFIAEGNPGS